MKLRLLLLLGCVVLFLTRTVSAEVDDQNTLIVANSKAWKPFSYLNENGEPAGILIDLWRAYGKANNVRVEFYLVDWNQSLEAMKSGKADVHGGLLWSAKRDHFLDYAAPIFTIETQLYLSDRLMGTDVNLFLEGKHTYPVGVVRGGYEEEFSMRQYPNLPLLRFDNNEIMLKAAFSGDIQAFIADLQVANFYLYSSTNPASFVGVRHLYSGELRPAVPQGKSRNLSTIMTGIENIPQEEKARIMNRWMYIKTVYPDYLWPIIGAITVIAMVAFIVALIMTVKLRTRQLKQANQELMILSQTDALTGLCNRRHFMTQFDMCVSKGRRVAVMVFDIDDFKSINDRFGHSVGDIVIREVAQTVSYVAGRDKVVGRIGGEEFAVVFDNTTFEHATQIANQICQSVRERTISSILDDNVTVSLGCAYYLKVNQKITLTDADKLMYQAKHSGKDQAVIKRFAQIDSDDVAYSA
ncbi:transporter substrate-binding domain-containing diguanylate cyclase [Vibrio proteolyticus]